MFLIILWCLLGIYIWIRHQMDHGWLKLGLVGDVLFGLPLCLIVGPVIVLSEVFAFKKKAG